MNNKNNIDYGIFTSKETGKKLVYYPVAKNANTSVKLFLIRHLNIEDKFYYIEDIPRYKHTKEMLERFTNKNNLINFLPAYTKFKKINVDVKCCVVRDPVKRFKSTFTNRILFHKDEKFRNYSVNQILENLEVSNFENRHFLPQTYWLGNDLNYFSFYSFTDAIDDFANNINNFFKQKRKFPKMQTGGNNISLDLSKDQIYKIKKSYASDFELLKI